MLEDTRKCHICFGEDEGVISVHESSEQTFHSGCLSEWHHKRPDLKCPLCTVVLLNTSVDIECGTNERKMGEGLRKVSKSPSRQVNLLRELSQVTSIPK